MYASGFLYRIGVHQPRSSNLGWQFGEKGICSWARCGTFGKSFCESHMYRENAVKVLGIHSMKNVACVIVYVKNIVKCRQSAFELGIYVR